MPKSLNEAVSEPGKPQTAPEGDRSLEQAKKAHVDAMATTNGSSSGSEKPGLTFAMQDKLPKLPIPELGSTMKKYLSSLKPLQSPREHAETQQAVEEFLKHDGPELQERLKKYANGKTSYIEQFCMYFSAKLAQYLIVIQGTILI